MKISLCMIVKNEEETLGRCLESAKRFFDELVIADTGSEDKTAEIARAAGARLFEFPWRDDFSAARNFVFSKAEGDYLFWLDADDVLSPDCDPAALRALLAAEPDVVMCPYVTAFGADGTPAYTCFRERFLRRAANFVWQGRVHECIAPRGNIVRSDFSVLHLGSRKERSMRNLNIYRKWEREERLNERDLFYYGRELSYHGLYAEAEEKLCSMLGGEGWYVNKIEASKVLSRCRRARGDTEGALSALFASFLYGEPRASVLCEIAAILRAENRCAEAAFWYESALRCVDHAAEGDFEEPACHALTPLLGLVCCHFALGNLPAAVECHKRTEAIAPDHPSVRFNREFFTKRGLL